MQESLEPLTATPVDCGEGTSPHSSQVTELRYSQGVLFLVFLLQLRNKGRPDSSLLSRRCHRTTDDNFTWLWHGSLRVSVTATVARNSQGKKHRV